MNNDEGFEGFGPEVAAVLNEAHRSSPVDPNPALLSAMRAAVVDSPQTSPSLAPRKKTMLGKLITAKALGIAGALVFTGGVAAASTGTLPDQVQAPVADVVDNVGIHIPTGEHGAAVSTVAHDKSNDGDGNHGQTVSETARDNHGHNKDTTETTVAGDDEGTDNSGPGNSRGHADDHATNKGEHSDDNGDDNEVTTTTTVANNDDSADDSSDSSEVDDQGSHGDHGGHGHDSSDDSGSADSSPESND
jgi:hypothetical protein